MKSYIIYSVRKPENIYRDDSETFTITAANLKQAISLGRRECRWRDTKFVSARFITNK